MTETEKLHATVAEQAAKIVKLERRTEELEEDLGESNYHWAGLREENGVPPGVDIYAFFRELRAKLAAAEAERDAFRRMLHRERDKQL